LAGCNAPSNKQSEDVPLAADDSLGAPLTKTAAADVHTSQSSLDWSGVYKGVIPCADCEGIQTTISLASNHSYTRTMVYLGKQGLPFSDTGNFTWDESGTMIEIKEESGQTQKYKVGENKLFHLDQSGAPITGALAEKYVLTKNPTDSRLEGKKWMLTELRGKPVDTGSGRPGFLQFDHETGNFSGNATCNNFFGTYELKEGSRITFGAAGSTMMACENMEDEKTFHEVLKQADNYSLTDSTLSLNKAKMAPLARFVISK
jgi:heat shock protein HslJ